MLHSLDSVMLFTALSTDKQVLNRVFGDDSSLYRTLNPTNRKYPNVNQYRANIRLYLGYLSGYYLAIENVLMEHVNLDKETKE